MTWGMAWGRFSNVITITYNSRVGLVSPFFARLQAV